ncbi:MAG: hypothetical protein KC877_05135 [Candidatus Kaiserbacteria bacterium]|nr:hypothetical protein [Candidatus Kaiserbacteria bacterium]MCB9816546.1 hypothetical protein [Candidatus Nomurabacteria bacterium]
MNDPTKLGRRVVIKAKTKSKAGKDHSGSSGKEGVLYVTVEGQEVEKARVAGPNSKFVQRKLRSTGLIPTYVTLKNYGETVF